MTATRCRPISDIHPKYGIIVVHTSTECTETSESVCFCICSLFNDAVSSVVYAASNVRVMVNGKLEVT
jgi:hypothetical protein